MACIQSGQDDSQPQYLFKKVTDLSLRTRFVFVGNCGPGVGMSEEQLSSLFEPVQPESIVVPNPTSTFVFLVFSTEQQATAAVAHLQQTGSQTQGRKLVLRYSEAKPKPAPVDTVPVARSAAQLGIPGVELYPNYVSEQEEQDLMQTVQTQPWVSMVKRRVQHYGWDFDYIARTIGKQVGPLPDWIRPLADRAAQLPSVNQQLDQLTVNEYTPGVGLSWHVDTHSAFTGPILSLSLGSDAVMAFRKGSDHRSLLLPRRSLLVLSGEARYAWEHQIPNRKYDSLGQPASTQEDPGTATETAHGNDLDDACSVASTTATGGPSPPLNTAYVVRTTRLSLTLRKGRGFPCDCSYPELCDSRQGGPLPTRLGMLKAQAEAAAGASGQGVESLTLGNTAGMHTVSTAAQTAAGMSSPPPCEGDRGVCNVCQTAADGQQMLSSSMPQSLGHPHQQKEQQQQQHAQPPHSSSQNPSQTGHQDSAEEEADRDADRLESSHVHAVYDAIAPHFNVTRFSVWPKVREFLESLPSGAVVGDVGCGNGKYFGVRSDLMVLGSDRSAGLAEVAAQRLAPSPTQTAVRADVLQADGYHLPYRDQCMDAVICIAVLHHVSSVPRRQRMLRELLRVLRPGGRAFVTVWAAEQEEPQKTLDKWTRIQTLDTSPDAANGAAPSAPAPAGSGSADGFSPVVRASEPSPPAAGSLEGRGGDYMVPWHMPLPQQPRKKGAAKASKPAPSKGGRPMSPDCPGGATDAGADGQGSMSLAQVGPGVAEGGASSSVQGSAEGGVQGGTHSVQGSTGVQGSGFSPHLGPAKAQAVSTVCPDKPLVVYQRYYHLFVAGELEQLVDSLGGCRRVGGCYDKSNWCVEFERTE